MDTGATYTVMPGNLLREMVVSPSRSAQFEYGYRRSVILDIGEARATINGESVITQIVFGEDGIQPLLGSYTLEGLLLAVDPFNRRLMQTHGIL